MNFFLAIIFCAIGGLVYLGTDSIALGCAAGLAMLTLTPASNS
jgi:hypothetical protein